MAGEDTWDPTRFDGLVAHPSIEALHALEPEECEQGARDTSHIFVYETVR